jgi:hypothetical protein
MGSLLESLLIANSHLWRSHGTERNSTASRGASHRQPSSCAVDRARQPCQLRGPVTRQMPWWRELPT